MSFELLLQEIIEEFRLNLPDVVALQRVSRSMYDLIKERSPRIFSLVTFVRGMEPWIHLLTNVKLEGLENLSLFARVHTLDISCMYLEDCSLLGRNHTLDLSFTNIKDVSHLGNVHTLNLSCTCVKDVSHLGEVHTLTLYSNGLITDFSALGKVRLNIEWY